METFGRVKTLIIRGRGCKNEVFGYRGIFIILGTLLDVILATKMHQKSHFSSLWASNVATLDPIWHHCTDPEKTPKIGISKTGVGGMRTSTLA